MMTRLDALSVRDRLELVALLNEIRQAITSDEPEVAMDRCDNEIARFCKLSDTDPRRTTSTERMRDMRARREAEALAAAAKISPRGRSRK